VIPKAYLADSRKQHTSINWTLLPDTVFINLSLMLDVREHVSPAEPAIILNIKTQCMYGDY